MSDINNKTETSVKNKELVVRTREQATSENLWIIGVSKTHPGLKYYFNTVTGVSLWNISREDMERAKQTVNANENLPQYINCPEPKDPPPGKKISSLSSQAHCEHASRQSKFSNKFAENNGVVKKTAGLRSDMCHSSLNTPSNIITVNFQHCPHSSCIAPNDSTCSTTVQSKIQTSTAFLETTTLEKHHYEKNENNLLHCKNILSSNIDETIAQDSNIEHTHTHSNPDIDCFDYNKTSFEPLDLTPMKKFAENSVIKDKWYIIADTNVYLNHINFLKTVVKSDNKCHLMVPQHVTNELEYATKTDLRTKAYRASYFIYRMFDSGFAQIVEDNSQVIEDNSSNEDKILHCYSNLKQQNFYVVVLSNNIELAKYRKKMHVPFFTVIELNEYLCKGNDSVTTKSSKSTLNTSQSSDTIKLSTPSNPGTVNKLPYDLITNPVVQNHTSTSVRNQNVQTTLVVNDKETQYQRLDDVSNATADVEVQTNFNDLNIDNEKGTLINKLSRKPSKRYKLRRKNCFNQTQPKITTNLVDLNETYAELNNTSSTPCNKMSLENERDDQYKTVINIDTNIKLNDATTSNTLNASSKIHCINTNLSMNPNLVTIYNSTSNSIETSNVKNIENENVMFEVTSDVMEQNLRRKCDEWVSRFNHIMEEVLTQVLRKNSYFSPPLNMYEAATCVEKRFSNDKDVADASLKFLKVLNTICNDKGNLDAMISPTQYMEMYSFGVYLIDALQGIFSTCEDLQTAAQSLWTLMSDIQNPDSDISNLEPFNYISQEEDPTNNSESDNDKVELFMIVDTESLSNEMKTDDTENLSNSIEAETNDNNVSYSNIERSNSDFELLKSCIPNKNDNSKTPYQLKVGNIECNGNSQDDNNSFECMETTSRSRASSTSPNKYNLRSRQRKMSSVEEDEQSAQKNKDIENIFDKNTFLINCMLQKNAIEGKQLNIQDKFNKHNITESFPKDLDHPLSTETNKECTASIPLRNNSNISHKVNTDSEEPKIVRNFVFCSEIEDRLRTRYVNDEMETLDFEGDIETENLDEGESSGDTGRLHIDEFAQLQNDNAVDRHIMERDFTNNAECIKINFEYVIGRIGQEIKELSSEVYAFSKHSYEVLNSLSTPDDRIGMRVKGKQVHSCIDKLCTALTNILSRNKNGGMQALLIHSEFEHNISIDEDQMEGYRAFIACCLEQAETLKNTISDVLTAVCELSVL